MLYQRNLYHLAIELAQKSGMDGKQQGAIFKKFGDHLYQKGSYDEAMTQYIKAIDSTEPSQVIRKVPGSVEPLQPSYLANMCSSSTRKGYTTSSSIWKSCTNTTRRRQIIRRCC